MPLINSQKNLIVDIISEENQSFNEDIIVLKCLTYKDKEMFVSVCLDLDIFMDSFNKKDARIFLRNAIKDYLCSKFKHFDKELNILGFKYVMEELIYSPVPIEDNPLKDNRNSIIEKFEIMCFLKEEMAYA